MIAVIERKATGSAYLVRDQAGRQWRVSSADVYQPGQSVVVLQGIIVAGAGVVPPPTRQEV